MGQRATGEFEDLVKAGGRPDEGHANRPNAASVATLLLTSDALVAEAQGRRPRPGWQPHDMY